MGKLVRYEAKDIMSEMSFLEMLDVVNEDLIRQGDEPIAFDSDCREGICGMCGQVVNGVPHGPKEKTTICQLHMRHFKDGDTIYIEPFRARAFPVIKDLIVERGAFDRIIQSAGYISAHTGGVPDGNAILIPKHDADTAMDASECIGCGACVAACPNGSAMLFTAAKVTHLAVLPQGRVEAARRVCIMTEEMLSQGFGNCGNHYECQAVCPKGIKVQFIARLNREFIKAKIM
jgi:succinate dehydrogenase / fumarate reductase iron-sulfur subunit